MGIYIIDSAFTIHIPKRKKTEFTAELIDVLFVAETFQVFQNNPLYNMKQLTSANWHSKQNTIDVRQVP